MKTKFTLLALLVGSFFATNAQQLPNASFETWTSPNNPDGWGTWESAIGAPLGLATKDTAVKVLGAASVKVKTDSVQAGPSKRLIAGLVSAGSISYAPPVVSFLGVPFTYRPDTLFFLYKYAPVLTDSAYVEIEVSGTTTTLLAGGLSLPSTAGQWFEVGLPLTAQITAGAVDSIRVFFSSSVPGTTGFAGTVLNVDGVRFGYVTLPNAIQELADKLDVSIYPNPASELLTISTAESTEGFTVTVADVTGKIVAAQNLQGNRTTIDVSEFANGTYIYRIADKAGIIVKQDRFTVAK